MIIDLGSRFEIDIQSEILEHLSKTPLGTEKWGNFRGTEFIRSSYILPKAKIGSLVFNNAAVIEGFSDDEKDCVIWNDPDAGTPSVRIVGNLGRKFFKHMNLLFDVQKSKMIVTNDFGRLKDYGYNLKMFSKVPFTSHRNGVLFKVNTDVGELNFMIDTGATHSFIHEYLCSNIQNKKCDSRGLPFIRSDKFFIGRKDFGGQNLYLLKMTPHLNDIGGVLGMDFIKNHIVYIDFVNDTLYIQTPENLEH